jgi:integrase
MATSFISSPLFDARTHFLSLDRDQLFPSEIPAIRSFLDSLSEDIPEVYNDYKQVKDFLWSKGRKSEATYNAFRSESERLLLWSWTINKTSLSDLKKRDLENYIDFVVKPPLSWIGTSVVRRFETKGDIKKINKKWRPFVSKVSKALRKEFDLSNPGENVPNKKKDYKLQQKSVLEVFSNLNVLFNHLFYDEYVSRNPILSIKKNTHHLITDETNYDLKRLSDLQWEYVLESTRDRADKDKDWERHLFIVSTMKSLYLRVSELSYRDQWTPTMGDFVRTKGNWWFIAFGKGNKKRQISVPDDYLPYLERYRQSRSLHGLPTKDEKSLLIEPKRHKGQGLKVRAISLIAQEAFDHASHQLLKDGFEQDSKELLSFSTHNLRHTGASIDSATRPLKDLSADLGHGMISTTDKEYIHSDDLERARSGKKRLV